MYRGIKFFTMLHCQVLFVSLEELTLYLRCVLSRLSCRWYSLLLSSYLRRVKLSETCSSCGHLTQVLHYFLLDCRDGSTRDLGMHLTTSFQLLKILCFTRRIGYYSSSLNCFRMLRRGCNESVFKFCLQRYWMLYMQHWQSGKSSACRGRKNNSKNRGRPRKSLEGGKMKNSYEMNMVEGARLQSRWEWDPVENSEPHSVNALGDTIQVLKYFCRIHVVN